MEWLWERVQTFWAESVEYLELNFDPWRDTVDIVIVAFAIYWLLLLIRGTRAVQILVGLVALVGVLVASEVFQLVTVRLVLENFMSSFVLIIIVLFQNDIRRALARVGRGFFPSVSAEQESQILGEVVQAAQLLAQKRVGALVVLERETGLDDQIEAGTRLDSEVSRDLLVSLFMPHSPLHDGAVVIQQGRIAYAGSILPLTLKADLPDGVGTRHRAAVGITEETDAVVVVVSEETATISVVLGGEIIRDLDGPKLRNVLSQILNSDRRELPTAVGEEAVGEEAVGEDGGKESSEPLGIRSAG
ncbi:MAG: TIGR00159 family protein [Deltaproteobacteria bacterium]|nr:MAG: TIGR00159 family protein [Deltaproteobacteria bacterium]